MKKTVYIHIGRPKVGSTAIQRFLKTNRKVLLKNGVLYPHAGEKQNASHKLAEVLLSGRTNPQEGSAKELYKELVDEIEKSTATSCVISSENFYFVKPKLLARKLSKKFDVKIICYIRRQDEVLVSSCIQELRDDSLAEEEQNNLDLYMNSPVRLRLLDYKVMLDQWADTFELSNVIVRVYESGQLKDNLFKDILDVMGLEFTDAYEVPKQRANPTPSSDVLELIKGINSYPASPYIRRQIKSRLVDISENIGSSKSYDAKHIFSIEQRQKVLAQFDKSNAETARKYFNRDDGRLFYHEVEKSDSEKSDSKATRDKFDLNRIVDIWLGVFVYQQQEITKLSIQLQRLQDDVKGLQNK